MLMMLWSICIYEWCKTARLSINGKKKATGGVKSAPLNSKATVTGKLLSYFGMSASSEGNMFTAVMSVVDVASIQSFSFDPDALKAAWQHSTPNSPQAELSGINFKICSRLSSLSAQLHCNCLSLIRHVLRCVSLYFARLLLIVKMLFAAC